MSTKGVGKGGEGYQPKEQKVQNKGKMRSHTVTQVKGSPISSKVPAQNLYPSGAIKKIKAKPVSPQTGFWGFIQKIVQFIKSLFPSTKQTSDSESAETKPKLENDDQKELENNLDTLNQKIAKTRTEIKDLISASFYIETVKDDLDNLKLFNKLPQELLQKREELINECTALFQSVIDKRIGDLGIKRFELQKEWNKTYPEVLAFVDINRIK